MTDTDTDTTAVRSVPPAGGASARSAGPRPLLLVVLWGVVVTALAASLAWRLSGGSLFTIPTASMCPELCVGTLIFDRPLAGPVRPGMVVSFRPPGTTTVYTHRVVEVLPGGRFKTAGDTLGAVDPWIVPRARVIGVVVGHLAAAGWVWRLLGPLAAALSVLLVARGRLPARYRNDFDRLFGTLLVTLPVLVERPLLRASVVALGARRVGGSVMTVVNTGLLPARCTPTGVGSAFVLGPGAVVRVPVPAHRGPISLSVVPALAPWQWALTAALVASPVLSLLVARARRRLAGRARREVVAVVSRYGGPA